jgi:hypothetical protein
VLILILALPAQSQDGWRPAAERAVQAAVIDSLFVRDTTRRVVVGDSTISGGRHFVDEDYRSALRKLGKLPAALRTDFETVGRRRRRVDSLAVRVPVIRFTRAARAGLQAQRDPDEYWQTFYRQYSGSSGLIELSRPGFSRDRSVALVHVEYRCGPRCGGTLYVLLERMAGAWHVARVAQPRIS